MAPLTTCHQQPAPGWRCSNKAAPLGFPTFLQPFLQSSIYTIISSFMLGERIILNLQCETAFVVQVLRKLGCQCRKEKGRREHSVTAQQLLLLRTCNKDDKYSMYYLFHKYIIILSLHGDIIFNIVTENTMHS